MSAESIGEKDPRLTISHRLAQIRKDKLSRAVAAANLPYNDNQKEYIANASWFQCNRYNRPIRCDLPLLDADSFIVNALTGQDSETIDIPDLSDNFMIDVNLFQNGSPFLYDNDENIIINSKNLEYDILIGPDAPPVMVHQSLLEEVGGPEYGLGSWRDLFKVLKAYKGERVHKLSDQDCENLISAVELAKVDVGILVSDMTAIEDFKNL